MKKIFIITLISSLLFYSCSQTTEKASGEVVKKEYSVSEEEFHHKLIDNKFYAVDKSVIHTFKDGYINLIDKNGKSILDPNLKYITLGSFNYGPVAVNEKDSKTFYYIDEKGNKVIDTVDGKKIYFGSGFSFKLTKVRLDEDQNSKFTTINLKGEKVKDFTKELGNLKITALDGLLEQFIYLEGNEFDSNSIGLYDIKNDKKLTPPEFTEIYSFYDSKAIAFKTNNDIVIIDENGKTLVNFTQKFKDYKIKTPLQEKNSQIFAGYSSDNKKSIIFDLDGKLLYEIKDKNIGYFDLNGFAIFEENGQYGIIDRYSNVVVQAKFDEIYTLGEFFTIAKKDNKNYLVKFEEKK